MSRIAANVSTEREKRVYEIFKTDPAATVAQVQKDLVATDGYRMNLGRIYMIRAFARAGEALPPKVKSPSKRKVV